MTEKQASPGWYPVENGERWWDGAAWSDWVRDADGLESSITVINDAKVSRPWGPLTYIVIGVIGFIGGGIVFALGADAGDEGLILLSWLVITIASVFFLIGVIAKGVVVGIRTSAQE